MADARMPAPAGPTVRVQHEVRARHEFRGMRTAEHFFSVPLDHFGGSPGGDSSARLKASEDWKSWAGSSLWNPQ